MGVPIACHLFLSVFLIMSVHILVLRYFLLSDGFHLSAFHGLSVYSEKHLEASELRSQVCNLLQMPEVIFRSLRLSKFLCRDIIEVFEIVVEYL